MDQAETGNNLQRDEILQSLFRNLIDERLVAAWVAQLFLFTPLRNDFCLLNNIAIL